MNSCSASRNLPCFRYADAYARTHHIIINPGLNAYTSMMPFYATSKLIKCTTCIMRPSATDGPVMWSVSQSVCPLVCHVTRLYCAKTAKLISVIWGGEHCRPKASLVGWGPSVREKFAQYKATIRTLTALLLRFDVPLPHYFCFLLIIWSRLFDILSCAE